MPPGIENTTVLLLDPMLATGGSAICAVRQLVDTFKVPEEQIVFVNLIACPEGLKALNAACPKIKVVTSMIDYALNDHKYILPGIGDFGDLYYGTY